jgi:GNAT superfamily N-acetyltransferase
MPPIEIRALALDDRDAWLPLWEGYQAFYKTQIPPDVTEATWRRFHDPQAPVYALGAWDGERLLGIVHYLFHLSTWTAGSYCYLQDLFTASDARGRGIGRALIAAVEDEARAHGASRVYWLTHETNAQAMRLYDAVADRSGFVQYRKLL